MSSSRNTRWAKIYLTRRLMSHVFIKYRLSLRLSINVLLIETMEKILGYVKFMKGLVTKMRAISFEDDDRLVHWSAIDNRSLV